MTKLLLGPAYICPKCGAAMYQVRPNVHENAIVAECINLNELCEMVGRQFVVRLGEVDGVELPKHPSPR